MLRTCVGLLSCVSSSSYKPQNRPLGKTTISHRYTWHSLPGPLDFIISNDVHRRVWMGTCGKGLCGCPDQPLAAQHNVFLQYVLVSHCNDFEEKQSIIQLWVLISLFLFSPQLPFLLVILPERICGNYFSRMVLCISLYHFQQIAFLQYALILSLQRQATQFGWQVLNVLNLNSKCFSLEPSSPLWCKWLPLVSTDECVCFFPCAHSCSQIWILFPISVSPPYVVFNDDSRIYINIPVDPCCNDNVCPTFHWLA